MNESTSTAKIFSRNELNKFLTGGIERCGKDFKRVRKELLKICDNERNPSIQWKKVRGLLLDNLESQIVTIKNQSNPARFKDKIKAGLQSEKNKPEHWLILIGIFDRYSYLYECIKIVAVLNAYENPQKLLPKGVSLINPEEFGDIHFYYLRHNKIRFYLYLKSGETETFDLDICQYNNLTSLHSTLKLDTYERKLSKRKRLKSVDYKEFYEFLKKEFNGTTYVNKISPQNTPSKNLSIFDPVQRKRIIRGYVGANIKKYGWLFQAVPVLDENAFYELLYKIKGLKRDLIDNYFEIWYPIWEPDILHLNPKLMSYQLADDFIRTLTEAERESCLIKCSSLIGFRLFNVKSFREIVNTWRLFNYRNIQDVLINNFSDYYSASKMKLYKTQKKYWSIYIDVNRLKRLGIKKKEAFEKLHNKYYLSSNTLCARYKEKAVEAKKFELTEQDIVSRYGLYEFNEVSPSGPLSMF